MSSTSAVVELAVRNLLKCKSWRNGRRMAAAVSGRISDDPGGSNPHKALARWGADGRAGSSPADLHFLMFAVRRMKRRNVGDFLLL